MSSVFLRLRTFNLLLNLLYNVLERTELWWLGIRPESGKQNQIIVI